MFFGALETFGFLTLAAAALPVRALQHHQHRRHEVVIRCPPPRLREPRPEVGGLPRRGEVVDEDAKLRPTQPAAEVSAAPALDEEVRLDCLPVFSVEESSEAKNSPRLTADFAVQVFIICVN